MFGAKKIKKIYLYIIGSILKNISMYTLDLAFPPRQVPSAFI